MPRAPTAQCSSAPPVNMLYMPSTGPPPLWLVLEKVRQHRAVQARDADNRRQPADRQHHQREQNPGLQFRNLEAVAEGVERWKRNMSGTDCLRVLAGGSAVCLSADDFARAAFGFDLGLGRGAEGVGADREFLVSSPSPRILMPSPGRWPGRALRKAASSTRAPSSKRFRASRFTGM